MVQGRKGGMTATPLHIVFVGRGGVTSKRKRKIFLSPECPIRFSPIICLLALAFPSFFQELTISEKYSS